MSCYTLRKPNPSLTPPSPVRPSRNCSIGRYSRQAFAGKSLHGVLFVVTAGQQDRELWAHFANLLKHLSAAQSRHRQIEDDRYDVFDVGRKRVQPLLSILRQQDAEPQGAQQIARALAYARFV